MSLDTAEFGKPIRPDQVGDAQAKNLPPQVIEVFNRLIASRFADGSAVVKQEDAVEAICDVMAIDRQTVFALHYLDVEEAFRAAGWKVRYERAAYNETGPSTFTFQR